MNPKRRYASQLEMTALILALISLFFVLSIPMISCILAGTSLVLIVLSKGHIVKFSGKRAIVYALVFSAILLSYLRIGLQFYKVIHDPGASSLFRKQLESVYGEDEAKAYDELLQQLGNRIQ